MSETFVTPHKHLSVKFFCLGHS